MATDGEIARWRAHSEVLNSVGWRLALALGRIPDEHDTVQGNPLVDVEELAGRVARYRTLQDRCAAWRRVRFPDSTPFGVLAKLTEEVGEVARAMVGLAEQREGRGDVNDEAAQVVLVLLSLVGWFYPGHDLLDDVFAELERQGG